MKFDREVFSAQGYCRIYVQIGYWGIFIGEGNPCWLRIEIFTPKHKFYIGK